MDNKRLKWNEETKELEMIGDVKPVFQVGTEKVSAEVWEQLRSLSIILQSEEINNG